MAYFRTEDEIIVLIKAEIIVGVGECAAYRVGIYLFVLKRYDLCFHGRSAEKQHNKEQSEQFIPHKSLNVNCCAEKYRKTFRKCLLLAKLRNFHTSEMASLELKVANNRTYTWSLLFC